MMNLNKRIKKTLLVASAALFASYGNASDQHTTQPSPLNVTEGNDSWPVPEYNWVKNGNEISVSGVVVEGMTSAQLITLDSDFYPIPISEKISVRPGQTVNLSGMITDPNVSEVILRFEDEEGLSAMFFHNLNGGTAPIRFSREIVENPAPRPEYTWERSGSEISVSGVAVEGMSYAQIITIDNDFNFTPVSEKVSVRPGQTVNLSGMITDPSVSEVVLHFENEEGLSAMFFHNFNASTAPIRFSREIAENPAPRPEYTWERNGSEISVSGVAIEGMSYAQLVTVDEDFNFTPVSEEISVQAGDEINLSGMITDSSATEVALRFTNDQHLVAMFMYQL